MNRSMDEQMKLNEQTIEWMIMNERTIEWANLQQTNEQMHELKGFKWL